MAYKVFFIARVKDYNDAYEEMSEKVYDFAKTLPGFISLTEEHMEDEHGTTEITVADVSKLPMPVKDTYYKGHAVPGVIFIGAERIEYYEVNHSTNKLLNCRRGTVTTTDENHTSGTKVYGITDSNTMAGNYETMWDPHSGSSGRGILNSSSHEARFLRLNKGAAIT